MSSQLKERRVGLVFFFLARASKNNKETDTGIRKVVSVSAKVLMKSTIALMVVLAYPWMDAIVSPVNKVPPATGHLSRIFGTISLLFFRDQRKILFSLRVDDS